jgi:hypothetical protein
MAHPGYVPAPPSVVTDFDAQSTVYATSSLGSPTLASGSKGTAPTSVTGSPVHRDGTLVSSLSASLPGSGDSDKKLRVGWPRLAQELAQTPCCEAFPRFRELNVKNLLYYQVEIAKLETELNKIELEDYSQRSAQRDEHAKSAEQMLFPAEDLKAKEQRRVVYEIRRLLKEYSKPASQLEEKKDRHFSALSERALTAPLPLTDDALLQHAQITAMPHPNYVNIECFRVRMYNKEFGEDGIRGCGNSAWGDPRKRPKGQQSMVEDLLPLLSGLFWKRDLPQDERDLVTVHQPRKLDGLTLWVKQDWTPFYHYHLRNPLQRLVCRRRPRGGERGVSSIPRYRTR